VSELPGARASSPIGSKRRIDTGDCQFQALDQVSHRFPIIDAGIKARDYQSMAVSSETKSLK
jgi:hypothetical protein